MTESDWITLSQTGTTLQSELNEIRPAEDSSLAISSYGAA
jgi:hypothetical protein